MDSTVAGGKNKNKPRRKGGRQGVKKKKGEKGGEGV